MLNEKAVMDQCLAREAVVEIERLSDAQVASASNVAEVFPEMAVIQLSSDSETETEQEAEEEAEQEASVDQAAAYDKVCREASRAACDFSKNVGKDKEEMMGFIQQHFPMLLLSDVENIVGAFCEASMESDDEPGESGSDVEEPANVEANEYYQIWRQACQAIDDYSEGGSRCRDMEELVWYISQSYPQLTLEDVQLMAEAWLAVAVWEPPIEP